MTTTNIDGTLVQLETLYNSYNTILDQAKGQLEKIDIDDKTRSRIAEEVIKSDDLRKKISEQFFRDMRSDLMNADEALMQSYVASDFAKKITEKIYEQISQKLDNYVKEIVDNVFTSDYVEAQLQLKIKANQELSQSITTKEQLKALLQTVLAD